MSVVKCGEGVSSFFPVNMGVRQGCVLALSLLNTCMDWVLGRVVERSHCGASVGNTEIADLVFPEDAAIFAESLEVWVMTLETKDIISKDEVIELVNWCSCRQCTLGGSISGE